MTDMDGPVLSRLSRRGVVARAGATAGVAGLGLLAAACGAEAPKESAGASAKTKEPVTLVLNGTDNEMGEMAAARFPAFEQKFPHVKVNVEFNAEYLEKLGVLFSSNTVGDVVFLEADDEAFYGFWGAQGQLTQLDSYIKR